MVQNKNIGINLVHQTYTAIGQNWALFLFIYFNVNAMTNKMKYE